ncbi:MAG: sporulation integral membrane protein YtvI [Clostridiales bacterium]|nr:sporulation integral membrane protein YtvI [Clostridiales bacterium]
MYYTMMEKLIAWNKEMNGIPRKAVLVAITFLVVAIVIVIFPYCWPFMFALLFAWVLNPLVGFVSKWFGGKRKVARNIATLLSVLLLFGCLSVLAIVIFARLFNELMSLVRSVPQFITWLSDVAFPYVKDIYSQYQDILPSNVLDILNQGFVTLGQTMLKWAGTLSGMLTSGAWSTAMSIPSVILSIVLTIMGTYYFTADKDRIFSFFRRTFPVDVQKHSRLIKTNLLKALFGQVKSQIMVSLIIITFLVLAFSISNVKYGLLMGLIIGVADALPVVGAGLFLIPWSIVGFVIGDVGTGIFMACAYLGTIVIRQIFEPRIVGKNLGLYPLATMIAMFAGYKMFGFLGLLAGPVLLNTLKVVLEADEIAQAHSGHGGHAQAVLAQEPQEDAKPAEEEPIQVTDDKEEKSE